MTTTSITLCMCAGDFKFPPHTVINKGNMKKNNTMFWVFPLQTLNNKIMSPGCKVWTVCLNLGQTNSQVLKNVILMSGTFPHHCPLSTGRRTVLDKMWKCAQTAQTTANTAHLPYKMPLSWQHYGFIWIIDGQNKIIFDLLSVGTEMNHWSEAFTPLKNLSTGWTDHSSDRGHPSSRCCDRLPRAPLQPPRCITGEAAEMSRASALSTPHSSAVTNRAWIKLLSGRLVLIWGRVVLTASIPLCTEAISTKCSHFQLLLGLHVAPKSPT